MIEGRRICPNDQSFSQSETQYYRAGVGPLGYTYRYSASFSGGGFFSSSSTEETVMLVASSLRGDDPIASATPTPSPVPTATATPDPQDFIDSLDVVFGPESGFLILSPNNNQIPDFSSGVNISSGAAEVIFENPNVTGSWSYGITFRHSTEETFHAVYVTSAGRWGHFARGGSVNSERELGKGSVSLNSGAGAENDLLVLFGPAGGQFYVNSDLVAELDIPSSYATAPGDVRLFAGLFATDTLSGAESRYREFTIVAPTP